MSRGGSTEAFAACAAWLWFSVEADPGAATLLLVLPLLMLLLPLLL